MCYVAQLPPPLCVYGLLLFLCCVFRSSAAYEAYRTRTSVLIPLPNSVYASLSPAVKSSYLFEWELYKYKPASSDAK